MKNIALALVLVVATCGVAEAAGAYIPIGTPLSSHQLSRAAFHPVKGVARPNLPGLRSVELELLEDALSRKMPKKVGSSRQIAHTKIIEYAFSNEPGKRGQMRGILAEALFINKNPNYGYVSSPTASQHDVYARIQGRKPPYNGQIKTHISGDPAVYANDMWKDYKSNHFIIPDDHVDPLKEYLRNQIREYEAAGRINDVVDAKKQLSRVTPLGYTSADLDSLQKRAGKAALRERNASYVSLGAATAMAFGPEAWEALQSGSVTSMSAMRMMHAGSVIATERAATYALKKYGTSILSGSLRGNLVTGTAILLTDTAFSVYEHGGERAFRSQGFYTNLGGSISAFVLGTRVGIHVAGMVTAYTRHLLAGTVTGLLAGGAIGTAGYVGGKTATRKILETLRPEFIQETESREIKDASDRIQSSITQLQKT